jgi:hypothetical protein
MEGAVIHSLTAGNDENVPCLHISKFTLEQATTVQREEQRYNYFFFNLSAGWGWVVNATPKPLYLWERDPVPIVQGVGWSPGPVWMGTENLALHHNSIPAPSIL